MYWVIEYKDKSRVTEKMVNFKQVNKKNFKFFYFTDDIELFGFNEKGNFIINNNELNVKNKKEIGKIIQFKDAEFILDNNKSKVVSWNLGYEIYFSDFYEQYILSIDKNKNIFLFAKVFNYQKKVMKEKKMQLR